MADERPTDHLTAPESAVRRRGAGERLSLGDCWREFWRQPSPKMIAAGIALALLNRARFGRPRAADLRTAAGLVAAQPFVEWVIHVYLLHSKPIRIAGKRVDLPAAREHREHHTEPSELGGVLVPSPILAGFMALIAAISYAVARPISRLAGGNPRAGAASGTLSSFVLLGVYEWTHFLIHTPYVPKHGIYRAVRRSHRLHHYKNEEYWFGVTSDLGDRVLGTSPDQRDVPRSPTARSLHESADG